jgi:peptide/nickel transport system permease protein
MTEPAFDLSASQVNAADVSDEGYWARVWANYNSRLVNRFAMWMLVVFAGIYMFADLIANGQPLLLSYGGEWYSPWLQQPTSARMTWALYPMLGAAIGLIVLWRATGMKRFLIIAVLGLVTTGLPKFSFTPLPTCAGTCAAGETDLLSVTNWREFSFGQMEEGDWAVFAPIAYSLNEGELDERLMAPTGFRFGGHLLGTDGDGRDLASRLTHGTRVSLLVGFLSVSIYVTIGLFFGGIAGFFGGFIDLALSRVIEVVICFPSFFLIITVLALIEPSIWNIMIVIGLTRWTGVARLFRAEVMKVRKLEYIAAARAMGLTQWAIMTRHVLPNAMAPVLVSATFGVAGAILVESSLSFLGFGVQIPTPSWGEALSLARQFPYLWWVVTFPGVLIFLTVTAYNLAGEGLRDATDPRQV